MASITEPSSSNGSFTVADNDSRWGSDAYGCVDNPVELPLQLFDYDDTMIAQQGVGQIFFAGNNYGSFMSDNESTATDAASFPSSRFDGYLQPVFQYQASLLPQNLLNLKNDESYSMPNDQAKEYTSTWIEQNYTGLPRQLNMIYHDSDLALPPTFHSPSNSIHDMPITPTLLETGPTHLLAGSAAVHSGVKRVKTTQAQDSTNTTEAVTTTELKPYSAPGLAGSGREIMNNQTSLKQNNKSSRRRKSYGSPVMISLNQNNAKDFSKFKHPPGPASILQLRSSEKPTSTSYGQQRSPNASPRQEGPADPALPSPPATAPTPDQLYSPSHI